MATRGQRRVVEHKDFSGGDWGKRQAWNAKPNQFSALNMMVYSTGELGVRPGIQDITPTNVSAGQLSWGMTNAIGTGQYFYGQDTHMYLATAYRGQTVTQEAGVFTGHPSNLWYANVGSAIYIMSDTQGVYSLITGTLTQLNAATGIGLAFFGDRLVTGMFTGTTSQLRYNGLTAGVSDLTSWPATNVIPVGDKNERISNLWLQRGHLDVIKQTNGIFTVTGQLGVNEVLRRAVNAIGPSSGAVGSSCLTENDTVWYVAESNHKIPVRFDGSNTTYYEDQLIPNQRQGLINMTSFAISDPDGVAITTGTDTSLSQPAYDTTKLMLFNHGVWTQHELPDLGNNTELTCTVGTSLFDPGVDVLNLPESTPRNIHQVPVLVLANGTSTSPKMYSLMLDLDRPGYDYPNDANHISFDAELPGDVSTAQVTGRVSFPEVHLSDASDCMVKGVIVDFRSWNTLGTLTNHFDLEVDCLRLYDAVSPRASLTAAWDESGAMSSTGGTLKRQVFMFGDQGAGNGYQLNFNNVRGIAFQRIQVILEASNFDGI